MNFVFKVKHAESAGGTGSFSKKSIAIKSGNLYKYLHSEGFKMSLFNLWLIFCLPVFGAVLLYFGVVSLILVMFSCFFLSELGQPGIKVIKRISVASVAALLIGASIPSREAMLIYAGLTLVADIEGSKEIPENVIRAANKALTDYISETSSRE